jgi:hypothetical protein
MDLVETLRSAVRNSDIDNAWLTFRAISHLPALKEQLLSDIPLCEALCDLLASKIHEAESAFNRE